MAGDIVSVSALVKYCWEQFFEGKGVRSSGSVKGVIIEK